MSKYNSIQEEVDALTEEYKAYILPLRAKWIQDNMPKSNKVWEIMDRHEREELQKGIDCCGAYVESLTIPWWKERGFGVVWTEDDPPLMKVYKLEEV